MPILVHSPHDGSPVQVREQDIGRAIRDKNGKIFYCLPRASGEGYFGSKTRAASAKGEEQVDALAAQFQQTNETGVPDKTTTDRTPFPPTSHDATGKRRKASPARAIVLLLILAALIAAGWYAYANFLAPDSAPPDSPQPEQTPTGTKTTSITPLQLINHPLAGHDQIARL